MLIMLQARDFVLFPVLHMRGENGANIFHIKYSALYVRKHRQGRDYDGLSYAPMDTDDFTLGLMMDCWVKIICRRDDSFENVRKKKQIHLGGMAAND